MAVKSQVFGGREVSDFEDHEADRLFRDIDMVFRVGMDDPQNRAIASDNQKNRYRMSWVCPGCDKEHRVNGSYEQVFQAAQQMMLTGQAEAVAILTKEMTRDMDLEDGPIECSEEVKAHLDTLFKSAPKGQA